MMNLLPCESTRIDTTAELLPETSFLQSPLRIKEDNQEPLETLSAPFAMVGINHQTASVSLRSRLALADDSVRSFGVSSKEAGADGCIVLSTCNRIEIYYAKCQPEPIIELLAKLTEVPLSELIEHSYRYSCVQAADHLFRVTAGLDSAVIGETEIVAQVKDAWQLSKKLNNSNPILDLAFQRSLEASKRVRTETDLCKGATSIASLAVKEAASHLAGLKNKNIVILGAGMIARRLLKELKGSQANSICVVNRTIKNSEALATDFDVQTAAWDELHSRLHVADCVFTALAVENPVLTFESLSSIMAARSGRKLVLIDLGLPPNVAVTDASSAPINNLLHCDIDRLTESSSNHQNQKRAAIEQAEPILQNEVARFASALEERGAAPTIKALAELGERVRQRNLEWAQSRLENLSEKEWQVVEQLAQKMVIGLLQAPIDGLKNRLATPQHREVVKHLFALDQLKSESDETPDV